MDSIIPIGQKNTLAEYMILSSADNRLLMLDKTHEYVSWKSRMELYMQNRENGRMILELVQHGPLIWPTIQENGVTMTKKYAELYATEKIQADCDLKATNIILQVLPSDIYSLVNHHRVAKDLWEKVQLFNARFTSLRVVKCLPTPTKGRSSGPREKVLLVEAQGNGKVLNEEELEFLADPGITKGPVTQSVIIHNATYQADDLDAYDSDCDEISTAKAILMANLVVTVRCSSEYLIESQNAAIQDTNYSAQQDALILSVFEQLLNQVTNCNKVNNDNLIANESLSADLERYIERVKLLEERQNVDLIIIMAQQQHAADVHPDELCPPNKRYDLMDANKKVDLEQVQCPPESKILTNIIKNHPLRFSIAASSSVPWIYMAQFWHTLKEDGSKYRLTFMLDKKVLSLTLDDFRTIFHLPQANANNHDSFVPPPSFLDMVPFYKQQLGFTMELKTSSSFKTTGLLQPWQTLCKIFSKCLTTRVTGWDQPPLQIMQMMYCFVNNIHVDYAELLWEGLYYSLHHPTSSIPYPRFTKIIISHYMT
ncbi:hypothetical protein Tco_0627517 [Tanacetum coccineum]|uniref:Uncharacterized protein n=1 Tax=Tanacetum coccineum TaxID=301880 RepID=A0ABQ4WMS5_9ASTR